MSDERLNPHDTPEHAAFKLRAEKNALDMYALLEDYYSTICISENVGRMLSLLQEIDDDWERLRAIINGEPHD